MAAKFVIALAVVGCVSGLQKREENAGSKNPYDQYFGQVSNLYGQYGQGQFPGGMPSMPDMGSFPGGGSLPSGGNFPGVGNFPGMGGQNQGSSSSATSQTKRQAFPSNFNEVTDVNKWGANFPGGLPSGGNFPGVGNFPGMGSQNQGSSSSATSQTKRQAFPSNFNEVTDVNKWGANFPGGLPNGGNFPGVGSFPGMGGQTQGGSSSAAASTSNA